MAGKSDFTPAEWTTLLESVMMAGIAVTAADPSGLWGTLKESMASAHAVMGAARDASANELIKAVTIEFETGEGRAAAREGLRTQLSGKKPPEITATALEVLKQAAAIVDAKAPRMPAPSRAGCAISPRRWRKLRRKAVSLVLAACRSAKPKRRRLPRSPQNSESPPKYSSA